MDVVRSDCSINQSSTDKIESEDDLLSQNVDTGLPAIIRIMCRLSDTECLAMLGSTECLGNWNPSKAFHASLVSRDLWEIKINLPPLKAVDFKFFVLSRTLNVAVRWERGGNRRLILTDRGVVVHTEWEGLESISEIEPIPFSSPKICSCKDMFISLDRRIATLEDNTSKLASQIGDVEKRMEGKLSHFRDEVHSFLLQNCRCTSHNVSACPQCPPQLRPRSNIADNAESSSGPAIEDQSNGHKGKESDPFPGPQSDNQCEEGGPTFWEQMMDMKCGASGEVCKSKPKSFDDIPDVPDDEGFLSSIMSSITQRLDFNIGIAVTVVAACFIYQKFAR